MTKSWQRRANRDLWEPLDEVAAQRRVKWKWISRNTKNPYHKEAHNLATNLASRDKKPDLPEGAAAVEELTHIDTSGRPCMVDVTEKPDTHREAVAKGRVSMKASTFKLLKKGPMAKGDVLAVAQLAGIMAAKQTPNLIPLCHPLTVGDVKVECSLDEENSTVEITGTVKGQGKTGMEMEAITATAIAALTIYDMCKAVDRGIQIENIRLIMKTGGKSGTIKLE
jgi:cyclic pyranopterin phosphate synthase